MIVARMVVPARVARLVSGASIVGPAPLVTGAKCAVTLALDTPAGKVFPVAMNVLPGCTVAGATEMILTWPKAALDNERNPASSTAIACDAKRSFI